MNTERGAHATTVDITAEFDGITQDAFTDDEKFQFDQLAQSMDFSKSRARSGRIDNGLSLALAHVNLGVMSAYGAPAVFAEKDREWRQRETLQTKETDSKLARAQKTLGRNALRIAGGVATVAGIAGMYYVARETALDHAQNLAPGNTVQSLDVRYLAKETHIYVPGNGDPTADMYVAQQKMLGNYDYSANNVEIEYSASIYPKDPVPMNVSTAEAANKVEAAVRAANGDPVEIYSFSQGADSTVEALRQMDRNGIDVSNVTVYIDGGPNGVMGLYNNPAVKMASPLLNGMGIDTDTNIPVPEGVKVVVRTYSGDYAGNGGKQNLATLGAMAMSTGHQPIGPGAVLIREEVINGVTYQEFAYPGGLVHPMSALAQSNGFYVSPEADRFFDSLLPVTHLGEETQYANANEVKAATAALIDDTLRRNGLPPGIAQQVAAAIMTAERTGDLQTMLDLQRTLDRFTAMGNDPSLIPTELPKAMNEIQAALNTAQKYLDPNEWRNIINESLRAAGIPITLPEPSKTSQTYSYSSWASYIPQHTYMPSSSWAPPTWQPPRASAEIHSSLNIPMQPIWRPDNNYVSAAPVRDYTPPVRHEIFTPNTPGPMKPVYTPHSEYRAPVVTGPVAPQPEILQVNTYIAPPAPEAPAAPAPEYIEPAPVNIEPASPLPPPPAPEYVPPAPTPVQVPVVEAPEPAPAPPPVIEPVAPPLPPPPLPEFTPPAPLIPEPPKAPSFSIPFFGNKPATSSVPTPESSSSRSGGNFGLVGGF